MPDDFLGVSWFFADVDPAELVTPGNSFRLEVYVDDPGTPGGWRLDAFVTADTGPHHLLDKFGQPLAAPVRVGLGIPPGLRGDPPARCHDHAGRRLRVRLTSDRPLAAGILHERV